MAVDEAIIERVARAMWDARELTFDKRLRQPFKARLADDIYIMARAAIEEYEKAKGEK